MYSTEPAFMLGFHGCDKSIVEKVISGKDSLRISKNDYDWLGTATASTCLNRSRFK